MLVPFTLSPACLDTPCDDVPFVLASLAELRRLWKRGGVLVDDPSRSLQATLARRLADQTRLPVAVRTRWKDLLIELKARVWCEPGWSPPEPYESRAAVAILPAESLLLEKREGAVWGIPLNEASVMLDGRVEVCRFDCLATTALARRIEEFDEVELRASTPISEALKLFDIPVRFASNIAIIDRYEGKEEVVHPKRSGTFRFLAHVGTRRQTLKLPPVSVRLYVAKAIYKSNNDPTLVHGPEILAAWRSTVATLPAKGIREVVLVMVSYEGFAKRAHKRHLRFDDWALDTDAGLSVFRGERIVQDSKLSACEAEPVRKKEDELSHEESAEEHVLLPSKGS